MLASCRGAAAAAQVATSNDGDLFPTARSGQFNLRRSQQVFLNRSHQVRVFVSDTLPSTAASTPGFCDITIRGSDPLQSFALQMTFTNNDAKANVVLTPEAVLYILDHIDVLGNNGSQLLERIDADGLALSYTELSPDEYVRTRSALQGGWTSNWQNSVSMGGGTLTCYIPILRCAILQNELMSAGLTGPITFRIWFRGQSWVNPGAAVPTALVVSTFQAICQTSVWDPSRSAAIAQRMLSGPRQDIRFANPAFQRTMENLVDGQPFTLRLSGISGLVTSMALLVRSLASSVYAPVQVKNVELLDPAGASISGGTAVDATYINLVYSASQLIHFDPTSYWQYAVRIPISGPNVSHAELRGHIEGYLPLSGSHQLRFVPLGTGAYQVSVIVYTVGMLSIERGQLMVATA